MNDLPQPPRYLVNIHAVAGTMMASLIIGALIGLMASGFPGFLTWFAIWSAYFFVGWGLQPFQHRMLELYDTDAQYPYQRISGEQTGIFLIWPMALLFTAIYIPLVLLLRRIFRAS